MELLFKRVGNYLRSFTVNAMLLIIRSFTVNKNNPLSLNEGKNENNCLMTTCGNVLFNPLKPKFF
jgi:hypothetical protein